MAVRLGAVAVAAGLAGCEVWRCDFESHGACIEFQTDPGDLAATQARMDRLLELELPYWNLHSLGGWRIQLRDTEQYDCYLSSRNEGCTDFLNHTISVHVPTESAGCFEAAELLHELGHYALGDPMHANPAWAGVDAQFAPLVWERPDAPAPCRRRYTGIHSGMWPVNIDSF
jgi:hypothetical protein